MRTIKLSQKIRPSTSKERVILVAVSGLSPAILTETVWALAEEDPENIPHEVVVLTTEQGKRAICEELLAPGGMSAYGLGEASIWEGLRDLLQQKYGGQLPDLADRLKFFADRHVRCFGVDGVPMEDITSKAHNFALADYLLEVIHGFTNPATAHTRIITSIAGGRKSMGALLYACMTLLGRPQDRVTHVLLSAPFDSMDVWPKFYFPVADFKRTIETAKVKESMLKTLKPSPGTDGTVMLLPDHLAKISLVDLPFVPLRQRLYDLPEETMKPKGGFMALVQAYQSAPLIGDPSKKVRISFNFSTSSRSQVSFDEKPFDLLTNRALIFWFLLQLNQKKLFPSAQEVPDLLKFYWDAACFRLLMIPKSPTLSDHYKDWESKLTELTLVRPSPVGQVFCDIKSIDPKKVADTLIDLRKFYSKGSNFYVGKRTTKFGPFELVEN